jgi:hypothetical protein
MEQNKYQRGVIYAIRSHKTNDVYLGSTTQPLHKRLHQHKCYNETSSAEILKHGDAYIELVENFPCNSKAELNKREGWYIRHSDCVNKNIAGRTKQEWYADNKEKVIEKSRINQIANKEHRAEYMKNYCAENRERLNEYKRIRNKKKSQLNAGSVSLS